MPSAVRAARALWQVRQVLMVLVLATALAPLVWAQKPALAPTAAVGPAVVVLSDETQNIDDVAYWAWVDTKGSMGLDGILATASKLFAAADTDKVYRLGTREKLWLRIRVARSPQSRHDWRLSFPLPLLDSVTVFQKTAEGNWTAQVAGDTIANRDWPEGGRYPFFQLEVPPGEARDVYVSVQHISPVSIPIRISPETLHNQRMQWESMALGMIFGAMLLLIVACLTQGLVYRERSYAAYALYSATMSLAMVAYTGVGGHVLWPGSGVWVDASAGCLALLTGAAALLFVRHLCGIPARFPRLDWLVLTFGFGSILAALVYVLVPRETLGLPVLTVFLAGSVLVGLLAAAVTWRRGDEVGRWVFLAYLPMGASVLLTLTRVLGWTPTNWFSQYGVVAAMALEVPLLLVALSVRLRERHGAEARAHALSSQDALTGLLSEHLFRDRLRQFVLRARRQHEPAAVVLIDLVNHAGIRRTHGAAVAEQSLLRTVIKLRRVLRDVDTVSRVGEARFGLILEGVNNRSSVTERVARLIASGLMPLKGLQPEVTLQFHAAAVLLTERLHDAHELMDHLAGLLGDMSPRTRRPIRFLDAEDTRPLPLEQAGDSLLRDSEAGSSGHPSTRPGGHF